MTTRYYVVKHSWLVIHKSDNEEPDAEEALQRAEFFYCESHCSENVARVLGDIAASVDGYCCLCSAHDAEMVGQYDTLEAAQKLTSYKRRPILLDARARIQGALESKLITEDELVEELNKLEAREELS